jgi:nitrite reductase/ring-hydroxylating ferredoxin subunit/uncharacterized membrane protein
MSDQLEVRPNLGMAEQAIIRRIAHSQRLDAVGMSLQKRLKRLWGNRPGQRVKDVLNGTWFGHPLHPPLTDVPLGAWTTALVLDALTLTRRRKFDRAAEAAIAVGIVGACGAVITGLADWSDTSGEPRRVGVAHAGLNSLALVLQIAGLWSRRRGIRGGRILSTVGTATAVCAAYLGGELAFRRGVQVDRTAHDRGPRVFLPAIAESELVADQPVRATVAGRAIMVVRHGDQIFALDDVCAHAGCSLSQGRLQDGAIRCACHGSTFRLVDGAVIHGPSPFPQPTFEVRIEDGQIKLRSRS